MIPFEVDWDGGKDDGSQCLLQVPGPVKGELTEEPDLDVKAQLLIRPSMTCNPLLGNIMNCCVTCT